MTLDMERGEVDGICGLDWSTLKAQKPDWIRDGKVNILLQFGLEPDKQLKELSVPSALEFIKQPEDRKATEVLLSQQVFSRPYAAPPGTPADRVAVLRSAFDATMQDKEFLAEALKSNLDISPTSGSKLQTMVDQMFATDPALVRRANDLIKP